jgi:hypothetical protein
MVLQSVGFTSTQPISLAVRNNKSAEDPSPRSRRGMTGWPCGSQRTAAAVTHAFDTTMIRVNGE